MTAIQQGKNWTPEPQTGPPCGASDWCQKVDDNPEAERRYICLRSCDKVIKRDHVCRLATGIYLRIISIEKAMPGYVRRAFSIGALSENDLQIIGAGVAFSGR